MTYCHISDRLLSSAPLGRDSVPEVYISRTGSSSPTGTYVAPAACANHSAMSVQPSGAPPIATRPVTVPAEAASALSATGTRASSTTKQLAPEWSRMNAISSAPSMKLTGTSTTPARAVAKSSTANCQQLWLSSASRSPLVRPASASAAAVRSTRSSNAANVSRVSPSTIASLSGNRSAVRRGRSPRLCWRACWTEVIEGGCAMPHRNPAGNAPAGARCWALQ